MSATSFDPSDTVARLLDLPVHGVSAVIALLQDSNTVPFIARYRKERTGGLDEVQIRNIQETWQSVMSLEKRCIVILESIRAQGKLTSALEKALRGADSRRDLEDMYLPYRPKRKTRASAARERGLEPLAQRILAQPHRGHPEQDARRFVNPDADLPDVTAVLAGARDIVAEQVMERADVRAMARETFFRYGELRSKAIAKTTKGKRTKFEDYYDFSERVSRIPSHRVLAIGRGEQEGFLRISIQVDAEQLIRRILGRVGCRERTPFGRELVAAIEDGYKRLLVPAIRKDVRVQLTEHSREEAIDVFAANLRNLLLAAPLGEEGVIAIDPGFRTGCKCVALDVTGRMQEYTTLFPHSPRGKEQSTTALLAMISRRRPKVIAIGDGTAGRETQSFVREALQSAQQNDLPIVMVNEAGASVYSASEVAREEFPDLDVTIRGAISIGRRLQDPLAELVKVDPRSLGIGQYQHDVSSARMEERLSQVVESCVNHVGVELNTASTALLTHVAGIGPAAARKLVAHRDSSGPFQSRRDLLKVAGIGPRTFEQAAGFLRIRGGKHPLDASAVHPERYRLVERMARDLGTRVTDLIGNEPQLRGIPTRRYLSDDVGEPTLRDILSELAKPGRDPREAFEPPSFRDDVRTMEDLQPGMELDGVVTNVTNFGAFVDLGVHQDGLVHISRLADRFVQDPHQVVQLGQRLRVVVLDVDLPRKRISLSARSRDFGGGG